MGTIYTRAEAVIAWLGCASKETVLSYHGNPPTKTKDPCRHARRRAYVARRRVYEDLAGNRYWTRAWITQELIIARNIVVAIGSLTFTFDKLREMIRGIGYLPASTEEVGQVLALGSGENILGEPLAKLLSTFREKKCSVTRDRIFSLLALCAERNHIKVDYGCSVLEMVYSIMKSNEHTFCACSTSIIIESLAPEINDFSRGEDIRYEKGPYIEIDARGMDWIHLGKRNKCGVVSYICSQAFTTAGMGLLLGANSCGLEHVVAPAKPPIDAYAIMLRKRQAFGSSVASIGQGLGRIRISLWYLYKLRNREGIRKNFNHLCTRPWTGTDEHMTPIRMGYGNWDINATGSALEESAF